MGTKVSLYFKKNLPANMGFKNTHRGRWNDHQSQDFELTDMGYKVTGILTREKNAFGNIRKNCPDILCWTSILQGDLDGIRDCPEIQLSYDIPIIYITIMTTMLFNRAKHTRPHAFISKSHSKNRITTRYRTLPSRTDGTGGRPG